MKLACESASSCTKPCASLKNPPGNFPVRRSLWADVRRKQTGVRKQLSTFKTLVCAFESRAQPKVQHSPSRRRSSFPPLSPNLAPIHAIEGATIRLRVLWRPTGYSAAHPSASRMASSSRRTASWRTGWTPSSNKQNTAASQPTG